MDIYKTGYIDGLRAYAHWKNGVQCVGTSGITLQQAEEEVEDTWNYGTPSRCIWTEKQDNQGYRTWDISCGHAMESEVSPITKRFVFCPFCGSHIEYHRE